MGLFEKCCLIAAVVLLAGASTALITSAWLACEPAEALVATAGVLTICAVIVVMPLTA